MANENGHEVPLTNSVKRKTELFQNNTTHEIIFTWKIDNFASKTKVLKNRESFKSARSFSADGDEKVKWMLGCFLGYFNVNSQYILLVSS